ncbi:Cro/CI family transcriptional regulator [Oryzomicrobium sp.]|uniref:Cro/CI family transcriptional regulator n=1 Tax=Oryzomicrobium sp. TaxID=1911578 RepID=UPI003FA7847B
MSGIKQAIESAGGQVALAEALGVSQQAISGWLLRGYVPTGRVVEIETLYGVPRARLINPRFLALVDLPGESEGGEL